MKEKKTVFVGLMIMEVAEKSREFLLFNFDENFDDNFQQEGSNVFVVVHNDDLVFFIQRPAFLSHAHVYI